MQWLADRALRRSPPAPALPDDREEVAAARRDAERGFLDAVDQGLEVRQLTGRLRERREANDWGTAIERSIWSLRGHP